MLFAWAVIIIIVLLAALLIYMEHEWGFLLGGFTAVVLGISYLVSGVILRSPVVLILPQGSNSEFDAFAITAAILLILAMLVVAYFAGRRGARKKDR